MSTEEVVLNVAKALNVNITPNDIEISHKLRRQGATDTIIIELKDIKLANIFPK